MSKISYIIKTQINKDGDLESLTDICPAIKNGESRRICMDTVGRDSCRFLMSGKPKKVGKNYLIKCNYKLEER